MNLNGEFMFILNSKNFTQAVEVETCIGKWIHFIILWPLDQFVQRLTSIG